MSDIQRTKIFLKTATWVDYVLLAFIAVYVILNITVITQQLEEIRHPPQSWHPAVTLAD